MKFFKRYTKFVFPVFLLFSLLNCSSIPRTSTPTLSFLDVYEIPFETSFQQTKVGGLSGIDYEGKNDKYFIISDDRAEENKARVYEASIILKENKIDNVSFQKVIYLKNENQEYFINRNIDPLKSADPEDLRYNPKTKTITWSSEGERIQKDGKFILQNPSLFEMNLNGDFQQKYDIPKILEMSANEKGPRRNGVLEGITFNNDFSKIYTNVEEPLYEDGERATTNAGGILRIFEFDTKTKQNTNQYFYPIDAIAKEPNPKEGFSVNGVSAILMYEKDKFLTVERSYSVGTKACTIKIYSFDLKTAQKSLDKNSIVSTKKLVLNLDSLGIFTDNIEGITFGPKLPNGDQTLLLISDNNFSNDQITQILLFKINK
ncbi:esterase-like activity of phytase family protein [Frigoriflavimonas asaccharolytica]|uniref:Phytase-like domain-containing protein n=1 Tax=Frigoriflavimonas asaccharolytica TaxID=2735899 RepID=A0A8J8G6E9_9FLAO|nr:esterase-like activity of phytase family protein [Frigoriflavimonas asaccharolytica]NRS92353.1 hypothetical protein [Frigoriflavimonas asaccharolytica]